MRLISKSGFFRDRIYEWPWLLAFGLTVAFFWLFIEVAEEIEDSAALEESMLLAFRRDGDPALTIGPAWLADAARDVTALGSTSVLLLAVFAIVGFFALTRNFTIAAYVCLPPLTGLIVSHILKGLFSRPRPTVVPHLANTLTSSFPSGHSSLSAVVYLTLGILLASVAKDRRVKVYCLSVAISLTVLIGCTRVFLGVHYPSDVLGGWAWGSAWALAWWLILRPGRPAAVAR